jgi:GWxTD domain-containing protein
MAASLGQSAQPAPSADWASSPEAVFLTVDEQKSWRELANDADRERFQAEYWKRRDPNPDTLVNEFKELVEARIAAADKYFALAGKSGSQTARGRVFVLLGPASSEQLIEGPLDNSPQYVTPWQLSLPRGALDHPAWSTWVYDARRQDLLTVIHRSSLELSFSIDPAHGDALQNPGRLEPIRRLIAEASSHGTAGLPSTGP